MFKTCKCGCIFNSTVCDRCGAVYGLIVDYDEAKTKDNVRDFIIGHSSVREFSNWKDYYDWDYAGSETLRAYASDCNRHRKQVSVFLEKYSNDELFELRERLIVVEKYFIANAMLKQLGYEYAELAADEYVI